MIRYSPFWLDQFPKTRRPAYPAVARPRRDDVVVVGGGLTGCACAWSLAGAGMPVVAARGGARRRRGDGGIAGLVREDFDASFEDAARAHGLAARTSRGRDTPESLARLRRGAAAPARSAAISRPPDLLRLGRPAEPDASRLRREYQARRDAGFDSSWLTARAWRARERRSTRAAAIRSKGFALDPYRACIGLAAAAASRKAPDLRAVGGDARSRSAQVGRDRDRRQDASAPTSVDRRDRRAAARPARAAASSSRRCTATRW